MLQALKGFFELSYKHASRPSIVAFTLLAFVVAAATVCHFRSDPVFSDHPIAWYVIMGVLYVGAIVPTILSLAAHRHKYIAQISAWTLLSLVAFLALFYLIYYAAVDAGQETKYERILNLPPVIAAAWAAALGWYIHTQLTMKIHRTNNSFALAMQTRTSAEYLGHLKRLRLVYSPFENIPPIEAPEHRPQGRKELIDRRNNLMADEIRQTAQLANLRRTADAASGGQKASAEQKLSAQEYQLGETRHELHKIEGLLQRADAIAGLSYILSYFEFMAVGIAAGDLDGDLLLKTMGENVRNLHERSANYRRSLVDGVPGQPPQKLACECLQLLIEGDNTAPAGDPVRLGWARRLDDAKVNGWK